MTAAPEALAQLLALAETLGVTPDELAAAAADPVRPTASPLPDECPTVAAYLPAVVGASTPGKAGTYGTYWDRLAVAFGDRRLDAVRPSDLSALVQEVRRSAVKRANARGGVGAAENCVAALRAFFAFAVADGLLSESPAAEGKLEKPRRPASRRRPLTDAEMVQLFEVARTTGNDPALDALIMRLHTETGCRRGGALALRLRDLDGPGQLVRLREKGGTERWQPVSATLLEGLAAHARSRGATGPDDGVLRSRSGVPITRRRYNYLAERWQGLLPWAGELGVSAHWVRHTAIATVERIAGFGVARAFAGHDAPGETTTTYIRASLEEVATAVAAMTGEPHPLAPPLLDATT